jgi:hypothetical protein
MHGVMFECFFLSDLGVLNTADCGRILAQHCNLYIAELLLAYSTVLHCFSYISPVINIKRFL